MLSTYLRDGLRSAKQSPLVTAINILCLALGLTAFVMTYGVVSYWESSDSHFRNAERIYVITTEAVGITPAQMWSTEHAAKYLRAEYPDLAVARERSMGETAIAVGERKLYTQGAVADPDFFRIFDFTFNVGDSDSALDMPRSAVISVDLERQIFGGASALGKTLLLDGRTEVTVTGVFQRDARSTHHNVGEWRFDLYASWDVHEAYQRSINPKWDQMPEYWSMWTARIYVLIPEAKQNAQGWINSLNEFGPRHIPKEQLGISELRISAIPVTQARLSALNELLFSGRPVVSVTVILMALGMLVLAIACVSYANLAAARNATRVKEVGTRKVLGATTVQLVKQQLVETIMQVVAAAVLATILTVLAIPTANAVLELDLRQSILEGISPVIVLSAIALAAGLVAAIYPATRLAQVSPVSALESGKSAPRKRMIPTVLVSTQFFVASFLLIVLIIMQLQALEMRAKALGPATDSTVLFGSYLNDAGIPFATFKAALSGIPSIASVASVGAKPWSGGRNFTDLYRTVEGGVSSRSVVNQVSEQFFETLNMRIVAGRDFAADRHDQSSSDAKDWDPDIPVSALIDLRLATELGFSTPAAAVDELVYVRLPFPARPTHAVKVIGVIDSRPLTFSSFGVTGNAYQLAAPAPARPLVRVKAGQKAEALRQMEQAWKKLAPTMPFRFQPLEQIFDEGYHSYDQAFSLMTTLVMLAFAIAVASLFAMALEVMGRTSYEVAVRKTLGAATHLMLGRLTWNLFRPVFLASLLSWPLAYLAGRAYLDTFMYRIELSFWPFVVGFVITSLVAWIAVGYQTLRAARLNPATMLRYE